VITEESSTTSATMTDQLDTSASEPAASPRHQCHVFGATMNAERWRRGRVRAAYRAQLRAETNDPRPRITAWEELHGVPFPSQENHALLDMIARDTRLTLVELQNEQRRRSASALEIPCKRPDLGQLKAP
jgi:hypothetical protein